MCMHRDTSEKWGLSYTNPEKWGQSYTFCWKKGPIIYLAALKKGAIRHAHPYYAIYRKLHPLPTPPHGMISCFQHLFLSIIRCKICWMSSSVESRARIIDVLENGPSREQILTLSGHWGPTKVFWKQIRSLRHSDIVNSSWYFVLLVRALKSEERWISHCRLSCPDWICVFNFSNC